MDDSNKAHISIIYPFLGTPLVPHKNWRERNSLTNVNSTYNRNNPSAIMLNNRKRRLSGKKVRFSEPKRKKLNFCNMNYDELSTGSENKNVIGFLQCLVLMSFMLCFIFEIRCF